MNVIIDKLKNKIITFNKKPIILFTEGWNNVIQQAAIYLKNENIIEPVLLLKSKSDLNSNIENIQKILMNEIDLKPYSDFLYELRKDKNLSYEQASNLVNQPNYLSALLVKMNKVNGSICGIEYATKDTLKPALQIVKLKKDTVTASSLMVMQKNDELLIFADIGMVVDPTDEQLCSICENTIYFAKKCLDLNDNNVALLSYSTNNSGSGESVNKVQSAFKIFKQRNMFPNENVYGEMQFDAAFDLDVAKKKIPSLLWNKKANIFIFPNLDSGNIGYKIAQRCGNYMATGPIVIGLDKPINDLSRGANMEEVINLAYITALQSLF